MNKTCIKCEETKPVVDFAKTSNKGRTSNTCKPCHSKDSTEWQRKNKDKHQENATNYNRTRNGLCKNIFWWQVSSSKKRGHTAPSYTIDELKQWILSRDNFEILYNKWVDSGYSKDTRPSVDRLYNDRPYSMDNIRLVTCLENLQSYWYRNKDLEKEGGQ